MHVHPCTCACCASAHGCAWHVHVCEGGATASRPTGRSAWRTACGFACCSTCSTRRRCACTRPQPSPHSMQHGLHSPVVTWPSHPPHPHPLYPQVLSFPPHACLYTSACTCCASLMCIMCMCTCTGALLPARGDERPHRLVARPLLPVRGGGRRDAGEGGRRAICGLCGGRRARTRARLCLRAGRAVSEPSRPQQPSRAKSEPCRACGAAWLSSKALACSRCSTMGEAAIHGRRSCSHGCGDLRYGPISRSYFIVRAASAPDTDSHTAEP